MNSDFILRLRRRFFYPPAAEGTASLRSRALRARVLIRIFYALNFQHWLVFSVLYFKSLDALVVNDPVWPLFWLSAGSAPVFAKNIFALNGLAALLGLAFPARRCFRIFAFITLFLLTAVLNSDITGWERMNSHTYGFVLLAFLFIFLPGSSVKKRMADWQTLLLTLLAQISVLAGYGASGLWRLRETISQLASGQKLSVGAETFNQFVSYFQLTSGSIGALGPYLRDHALIAAPLMLLATLFELSCLWVITRPGLYRAWGLLIVLFHLGFVLSMNLLFSEHLLLVLLFLVCSPFREEKAHEL